MTRLLLSLGIIVTGLLVGYGIQRLVRTRGRVADPSLSGPRRKLQVIALLILNPVAAASSIWIVDPGDTRLALMPLMGVLVLAVGGAVGLLVGRARKLAPAQAGAFFCASAMFNMGAIGALVVFIFLGEAGFALVPLFRLFEEFLYYSVGFPIAKSYSSRGVDRADADRGRRFLAILLDPFILVVAGSIITGFVLNLSGIERPQFFGTVNSVLIPAASLLMLISLGMALRLDRVGPHIRDALLVAATKYLAVPAVVVTVAAVLGLGRTHDGMPLKVTLILASTPVAFIALVPPSLYKLDVDLANSAWLVTTALLAVVIPLQMLVVGLIG